MHACIFTKKYRENVLNKTKQEEITDWDVYNISCYMYYEPLCYQLVEATENQTNWYDKNDKTPYGMLKTFLSQTLISYLKFLELDKSHDGYNTAYILPKLLFIIILIIFLYRKVLNLRRSLN